MNDATDRVTIRLVIPTSKFRQVLWHFKPGFPPSHQNKIPWHSRLQVSKNSTWYE